MQRQTRQSKMPCKGKQDSLKCHAKANKTVENTMQRQKQGSLKCHAKGNKAV